MSINVQRNDVTQFVRYMTVGVMNTLVTLAVIYVLATVCHANLWVSNAAGYVAGVINSFLWNKIWVFKSSSTNYQGEALRFLVGFLLCYGLQFFVTWALTSIIGDMEWNLLGIMVLGGYGVSTIIGMIVYTIANFLYNRVVTFSDKK